MKDLLDCLDELSQLLEAEKIEYVVMGGMAVRVYGIPRATYDLDFTITIPRDQLPRLYDLMEAKGYTVPESYRRGWVDVVAEMPLVKCRVYLSGQGIDLDFFLAESEFQKCVMQRKRREQVNGCTVWIVSPEDLILLKLIANRTRDLADIKDVLFTQGALDQVYLKKWAEALGVRERLEEVWREVVG